MTEKSCLLYFSLFDPCRDYCPYYIFTFPHIPFSFVPQDVMGFNSAALQFLQREIESKEDVMFFADATGQLEEKKRKRRRRERAILTIA